MSSKHAKVRNESRPPDDSSSSVTMGDSSGGVQVPHGRIVVGRRGRLLAPDRQDLVGAEAATRTDQQSTLWRPCRCGRTSSSTTPAGRRRRRTRPGVSRPRARRRSWWILGRGAGYEGHASTVRSTACGSPEQQPCRSEVDERGPAVHGMRSSTASEVRWCHDGPCRHDGTSAAAPPVVLPPTPPRASCSPSPAPLPAPGGTRSSTALWIVSHDAASGDRRRGPARSRTRTTCRR